MKHRKLVISVILLGACLCLWQLRVRHRAAAMTTPSEAGDRLGSRPSAVPVDSGQSRRQSPAEAVVTREVLSSGSSALVAVGSNAALQRLLGEWQAPIEFYGKVVDESNSPVAGASVRFNWDETPLGDGQRSSTAQSDSEGLFSLRGERGRVLEVRVAKDGYYTPKPGFQSFGYSMTAHYSPDAQAPEIFRLKTRGRPEPLLRVAGNGLAKMRDYLLSEDGAAAKVSLRDGRQAPIGQGDIRLQVWVGKPVPGFPSRFEWKCRVSVPDGGLLEVKDEFPFLAPAAGLQ